MVTPVTPPFPHFNHLLSSGLSQSPYPATGISSAHVAISLAVPWLVGCRWLAQRPEKDGDFDNCLFICSCFSMGLNGTLNGIYINLDK